MLAALLAVLVARPLAVGAVLLAGLAVLERWGNPSLEAVAGAQAVLGSGGLVGPAAAAASAWLAAAALVLASPRAEGRHDLDAATGSEAADGRGASGRQPRSAALVVGLATGSSAALVVAGPDLGAEPALRLAATAVAVVVAALVASLRWQQVTAALALVAAVLAAAFGAAVATGRIGL